MAVVLPPLHWPGEQLPHPDPPSAPSPTSLSVQIGPGASPKSDTHDASRRATVSTNPACTAAAPAGTRLCLPWRPPRRLMERGAESGQRCGCNPRRTARAECVTAQPHLLREEDVCMPHLRTWSQTGIVPRTYFINILRGHHACLWMRFQHLQEALVLQSNSRCLWDC